MATMTDWKEKLDRAAGQLSKVPETLREMREEQRAAQNKINDTLKDVGERLARMEGQSSR